MKNKILVTIGIAVGGALYAAIRHGLGQIDWVRIAVMAVISFVILLMVPNRWIQGRKSSGQRGRK